MSMPKLRIVVVDDFQPWRDEVRRMLQAQPDWEIIADARDGVEAVQIAAEKHPDIVLLDIGMPNMNGVEAALRIAQVSPNSRIIFLSEHTDSEVMVTALNTGAKAYVVKRNATRELVRTIAALAQFSLIIGCTLISALPVQPQ